MSSFHTIAIPHDDILEGRLTLDIFAADLWNVVKNRGPNEYKDSDTFFHKTYETEGLKNLLSVVERRLSGEGGESVIQVQTPFGGGKTHSLIAMYHKAKIWGVNTAVVVGTELSGKETLWAMIEKQLTGEVKIFNDKTSPGKQALRKLLEKHSPVLILMDEVLQYVTKAAGTKVGDSTLAAQTLAFMQELTETASSMEKLALVVTMPSSNVEHYDESAENLFQKLQKVSGRIEKIYTPIEEHEITRIIRRRLFADINKKAMKKIVNGFIEYAEKENILPAGMETSEYRNRFINSYPFMPEIVDILYGRWGSFPEFQRTRGVLRILSLVISELKDQNIPYISLSDFELGNQELRQELIKHIGTEFNSVIGADISGADAGSKKVDATLGKSYQGLQLGKRASTAIFLYSFSGGPEKGATPTEIKRCSTTTENPASVIAEVTEQLKNNLFYLQNIDDRYFFSNQPNLNRIKLTKMENVKESDIVNMEKDILKKSIRGDKLDVFLWQDDSSDIRDDQNLKLVILPEEDNSKMKTILENKGKKPRVHRNTIFFLYPMESERSVFINNLKKKLAFENIKQDKNLNLTNEQLKKIRNELRQIESESSETLCRFYRCIAIPSKDGLEKHDLGIPTYGENKKIDEVVYEKLRAEGKLLPNIAPIVIKEKYLVGKDFVSTSQICTSSTTTPGEIRAIETSVWEKGIAEGVRTSIFGLGELEDNKPVCRYYGDAPTVSFSDNEVIIKESLCKELKTDYETEEKPPGEPTPPEKPPAPVDETERGQRSVHLKFVIPKGKVSDITRVMNLLQTKFDTLEIQIDASDGKISDQEFDDNVMEAFRQLGIDIKTE